MYVCMYVCMYVTLQGFFPPIWGENCILSPPIIGRRPENFGILKWAETFKNEVFGAEGAENFEDLKNYQLYPPLFMAIWKQGGV